ncbi:preprotein translocase subunit TatC, partial [Pseudomonas sp. FW305-130]
MTTQDLSRRERLAPGAPVGVTEAMCRDLVDEFYARVRADPVLGPIFN